MRLYGGVMHLFDLIRVYLCSSVVKLFCKGAAAGFQTMQPLAVTLTGKPMTSRNTRAGL